MKSLFLLVISFVVFSCHNKFSIGFAKKYAEAEYEAHNSLVPVIDFHVERLSGSRVKLSWHSEVGQNFKGFEVMRKLGRNGIFQKVGSVKTQAAAEKITDYSITDINAHSDSSYYSIMQVDNKGAKYFSKAQGVGGRR